MSVVRERDQARMTNTTCKYYCKFGQILVFVCLLGGLLCFHEIGAEGLGLSQGLKINIQIENTNQLITRNCESIITVSL